MTRMGLQETGAATEDGSPSPQPSAGSRPTSPAPEPLTEPPSSPPLLATMTPVNVMDLQKDYNEEQLAQHIMPDDQMKHSEFSDDDEHLEKPLYDPMDTDGPNCSVLVDPNTSKNATVSVVVPPPLLGSVYHHQAGTGTVLVLSEFTDDMTQVIEIRKRKESVNEEYLTASPLPPRGPGSPGAGGRMAELPPGEPGGGEDGGWRAYYEHPLTAATSAMLNISGGGAEDQGQSMGFIYEYYKLPQLPAVDKDKLAEIWPTTSTASGGSLLASQIKQANGLGGGAGLELLAPPPGSASPGSVSSGGDLQGLFLHHHQQQLHHPHLHHTQQQLIVKREPEDLSHHRHKATPSPGIDHPVIISNKGGGRHKVVLVSSGGNGAVGSQGDLVVDIVNNNIKEELHHGHHRGLNSPQHGSRSINGTPTSSTSSLLAADGSSGPIELIATADGLKPAMSYNSQIFASMSNAQHHGGSGSPSPIPYPDHVTQYTTAASQGGGLGAGGGYTSNVRAGSSAGNAFTSDPYYREYFTAVSGQGEQYSGQLRQQQIPSYVDSPESAGAGGAATASFVERYVRQSSAYHNSKGVVSAATAAGLTVDLPSPDSGIGADAITPRDQTAIQQNFDYTDLCQAPGVLTDAALAQRSAGQSPSQPHAGARSRPWHDFGRQNDADKIQIPKIHTPYGFKYHLETPISSSQRREDDRITYINKGQFYGITLEYIPDPDKPLKTQTVKSIVMLMFREEKSPEDEIKAWQFWHGRQHSVKQRILDADTKNSVGLVGCIEEVSHNAIAIYWNPLESAAKINIAVQCLSTDFSSQKGVKGLPLHIQIDTYEDPRDTVVYHRGYNQIKVFCDKGAERKTRDEERRAAKRKMTATGRKKLDELYHPVTERSEFYSMSDLTKPPVLFTPAEDIDKLTSMELQGFYSHDPDNSSLSNGDTGSQHGLGKQGSPYLLHSKPSTTPTLKFHNHFPPDMPGDKKDGILDGSMTTDGNVFSSPPLKRPKMMAPPTLNERVMLYVRQDADEVYTPLHVVPPTTQGLLNAIENKYKISTSSISNLFRKNRKGIIAKIDDDMLKYYCNEDLFLLEIKQVDGDEAFEVTLIELQDN